MKRQTVAIFVILAIIIVGAALLVGPKPGGEPVAEGAVVVREPTGDTIIAPPGVPASVAAYLRNGQAWRAARVMRDYLDDHPDASPEAVLLAARAEAEWGGWSYVRDELEGEEWLGEVKGGAGLFWLARAREEEGELPEALAAYTSYLKLPAVRQPVERRRVAELRQGLVLLALGREKEGVARLESTRSEVPAISGRLDVLAAEALAPNGDTAAVRRLVAGNDPARLDRRGRSALLTAYENANAPRAALALAQRLRANAAGSERADLSFRAAKLSLQLGDSAAARTFLLDALDASAGSSAARDAAKLLPELGPVSTAEKLVLARVLARHGATTSAAKYFRAWLASDAGTEAEARKVRRELGSALFNAGQYGAAITALRPLTDQPGSAGAEALYTIGRAQYRAGNENEALKTFASVAKRFPHATAGAEGLFFVADVNHDRGNEDVARALYRRVADEFPGTDRSGLALMRLGGLHFLHHDYQAAARVWEEYRSLYPQGQRWLQSTYWAGRAYAQLGDTARAHALWRAVRERDPLSYYSLEASKRLKVDYWPAPMRPAPPADSAARARVDEWMKGVTLLSDAGLHAEAEARIDELVKLAGDDRALLYPLAEALNERGYTVHGIGIGYELRDRDGLNPRVLRIIYPFPYRAMVAAEAKEQGLDPFMVAAMIRQESSFKARIASPVGARGLMQVMPKTGEKIATAADIDHWRTELLYQPEINVHLGTLFLADQMHEYDGVLPAVFSAYNAGPGRVDVWEEFPEFGEPELFTERIPYTETRDYVKILTRNMAIYRGLYSAGSS